LLGHGVRLHVVRAGGLRADLSVADILTDSAKISKLCDWQHIGFFAVSAGQQNILMLMNEQQNCLDT
jgi:hypothetical protein